MDAFTALTGIGTRELLLVASVAIVLLVLYIASRIGFGLLLGGSAGAVLSFFLALTFLHIPNNESHWWFFVLMNDYSAGFLFLLGLINLLIVADQLLMLKDGMKKGKSK